MSSLNVNNIKEYHYISDELSHEKFDVWDVSLLESLIYQTFGKLYTLYDNNLVGYHEFKVDMFHCSDSKENYIEIELKLPSKTESIFARYIDSFLSENDDLDPISLDFYNKFRIEAYRDDLPF